MLRANVILIGASLFLAGLGASNAAMALRVLRDTQAGEALLANGNFEQMREAKAIGWQASQKGYRLTPGEGRARSVAMTCENPSGDGWFGGAQTLTLNRTNIAPFIVRGWSKAQNVSGGADSGYSLYVDLTYTDGTPLWGQTANFRCGTHDWEKREITILPDKPVKSLTLHCLFRGHAGKVWFDDVTVEEVKADGGAVLFQGVPVVAGDLTARLKSAEEISRVLTNAATEGLLFARDVAANSDFIAFSGNQAPGLKLDSRLEFKAGTNHIAVQGRVSDTSGRDRAVSLVFALPLDATGWHWGEDIRRSRVIAGNGEFVNQVSVRGGSTGTMSLYPQAAVWNDTMGVALALDMAQPAVCRVGYHAGLKLLFVAYDFGLTKNTARFPSSAEFRLVMYRFNPQWGFRAAWQRYMEIFPEYFIVRAREQGLWMPFTDVSKVEGWQDFGFKFHEGNNNVPWDDEHGVLSFRYTEPMTWWMPMKKELPRTADEALRVRDELAKTGNTSQRQMAEASRTTAMFDEAGQPALIFRNEPWCNGAVWSLNPNPYLQPTPAATQPTASPTIARERDAAERVPTNAATVHWNPALKEKLYGPAAKGRLDGEYLDSLEGYVTAELNFRREHFRDTTVPLTFSTDTKQPALCKGLAVFEFTRWMSDDVHRMGKLMFANGVPYRFTFLSPWLDVLGTETDWLRNGKYTPASEATMNLWRTASGAKPYLLLMNTDYDKFTPDLVEKYFQRALFYGLWPGFFSHNAADNPYWQNPKWYNRDRPLFRKYIPVIKRVAEAGWQPVTGATCDNERIWIERFGPDAKHVVFITLHNNTAQSQSGLLHLDPKLLGFNSNCRGKELFSGAGLDFNAFAADITLTPSETKVVMLTE